MWAPVSAPSGALGARDSAEDWRWPVRALAVPALGVQSPRSHSAPHSEGLRAQKVLPLGIHALWLCLDTFTFNHVRNYSLLKNIGLRIIPPLLIMSSLELGFLGGVRWDREAGTGGLEPHSRMVGLPLPPHLPGLGP